MRKGSFRLSSNISDGFFDEKSYIKTPNAQRVAKLIADDFNAGIHTFSIVGAYGTGKSTFLLQFEKDLLATKEKGVLINPKRLLNEGGFEIMNIVGDYAELSTILQEELGRTSFAGSILDQLNTYYKKLHSEGKLLVIVIDEFGKVLEHAAKNNPERELYFLQKFAEFVNLPSRDILLLTTLHQNFGAYSKGLTETQVNEWVKVKGRFKEVTFIEPIEQLLYLAAKQYDAPKKIPYENVDNLIALAHETNFVSDAFSEEVSKYLYPLDPFAAYVLTSALQRYGQNERSLFSFLASTGEDSLAQFQPDKHLTYNLSIVYDYIVYSFYSYLRDTNADSMCWSAMQVAVERVELVGWEHEMQKNEAVKMVKAIGLMGLFGTAGFILDAPRMSLYAREAMNIQDAEEVLKILTQYKIIRFAAYKSRLMLFDGTDIDLEAEIRQAGLIVDRPVDIVGDISQVLTRRVFPVKAHFYKKRTPRYFQYEVTSAPVQLIPKGDVDGYVELVFSSSPNILQEVKAFSAGCENATVFAVFNNTEEIVDRLYNIKKYEYILEKVIVDDSDRVAKREMERLKDYEESMLNKTINDNLFAYKSRVSWFYCGEQKQVGDFKDFNQLISEVCDKVYNQAPIINSELFNRNTLSASISIAKKKFFSALFEHGDEHELGFPEETFPPEKTIYWVLLKETGLHDGKAFQEKPTKPDFLNMWEACECFLKSTENKMRNVSELNQILSAAPFKMKQGFLDFWIPLYLYLKRQDFALYYVPAGYSFVSEITMTFLDLYQKNPSSFALKKFTGEGVKMEFYKKYREMLNLGVDGRVTKDSFIETIKPFLAFYARQNDYAKTTHKFDHQTTAKFRDVLATAKDPEKAFLEDLPEALGFSRVTLRQEAFVEEFGLVLQQSINELRSCYSNLISRIERHLIRELKVSGESYDGYITEIRSKLDGVKVYLLTEKQREFYNRVMTPYQNKVEWYQSICYTVLGKNLEKLKDEQEDKLLNDLVYLFRSCEKYADISRKTKDNRESVAYSFDLVSNQGTDLRTQTYVLPANGKAEASKMEEKIEKLLTGQDDLDVCVLLSVLNKKLGK